MPTICVNGTTLYYEDSGGPHPPIVFSHGLLFDTRLFAAQVAALRARYRCIAYDHRGQGRSAQASRAIDIETVTLDAIALLEALDLGAVHFCGLSMGGFVGMHVAARRPDLVRSLTLMDTSPDPEVPENLPKYRWLNERLRRDGGAAIAGDVMPVLFARSVINDPARAAETAAWRQRMASLRRTVAYACDGVLDRPSMTHVLRHIQAPTLVIVGEEDVATVPAKAEKLHAAIAGSRLVRIPCAGHSAPLENPTRVNLALEKFLAHVDVAYRQPLPVAG